MSRLVPRFVLLTLSLLALPAFLSTRADPPRQDASAESRWLRKLPSGVTVELLGITDAEAKPAMWWTPAGKPMVAPVTNGALGRTKAGVQVRGFALRVEGPTNDDLDVIWDFGKYFGGDSTNGLKDGEPIRGMDFASVELPGKAASWTIRLKVSAARWVTDATRTSNGEVKINNEGRSVIFTEPHAIERGTHIVVAEDFPERDVRVVAFDKEGRQRSASASDGGWYSKAFRVHDASLIGIKPDQVDRYELQSRPVETIEFRNVPLVAPKP
jgi:hypothetical protein